jgi:hypothetical protein
MIQRYGSIVGKIMTETWSQENVVLRSLAASRRVRYYLVISSTMHSWLVGRHAAQHACEIGSAMIDVRDLEFAPCVFR